MSYFRPLSNTLPRQLHAVGQTTATLPAAKTQAIFPQAPTVHSASPRLPCLSATRLEAVTPHTTALVLSEYEQEYYREVNTRDADLDAAAPSDFYQLLGLEYDADGAAIRIAYRTLQRIAHPDIAGETANELSALLNSAYATLSNLKAKETYDAALNSFRREHAQYDGLPVSEWWGPPGEQRAVLVDETQCIGCTQCASICPSSFFMEDDYGRARVMRQWGDDADAISEAIDLCPVDCIHYVPRDQLALLEFVMKSCKREDIAIVARRRSGNMGTAPSSQSPFEQAATFLRHRREARPQLQNGSMPLAQDRELAATIARAWLALPRELQRAGWPSWCEHTERVSWGR